MAGKKGKGKKATEFETFNKSQHIYKLLEKGIIESEALSGNSTDRPEQEDHIAALLGSAEVRQQPIHVSGKRASVKRSQRPKKHRSQLKKPKKAKRR